MSRVEVVRPYVFELLKRYCGTDDLAVDHDGDVPIRRGSTMYWVSLFDDEHEAHVRVWSYVVRKVDESPELLSALNEINATVNYARVFWEDGDVLAAYELLADDLELTELANACDRIGGVSDRFDDELAKRFGGTVFFSDDDEGDEEIDV